MGGGPLLLAMWKRADTCMPTQPQPLYSVLYPHYAGAALETVHVYKGDSQDVGVLVISL